jgi:hypothetical protein
MTDQEATRLGLEEETRRLHIRVANGKANMEPLGKANWMRLETENLSNGDIIAVVTRWQPPNPFENVSSTHMHECRRVAGTGEFRRDARAKNWFGYEVARVVGIDDVGPKTAGRRKVTAIIETWLKNKVLTVETKADASHHEREYIVLGPLKDDTPSASQPSPASDDSSSDDE